MATGHTSLPPLDVTRAPEGGEVGAIQSGWRLALREFMSNRLAVVGVAILLFFVVVCSSGRSSTTGIPCRLTSSAPTTRPVPGTRSAPTSTVSTSSASS